MNKALISTMVALLMCMQCALAARARAAEPKLTVAFTDKGELNITLDGNPISQPTLTLDPTVRFRDPAAVVPFPWGANDQTWPVVPADGRPQKSVFDAKGQRLIQTFAWGEVVRSYRVVPGGVDIEVTVSNRSPKTLCEFRQRLFTLKLPADTSPAMTTEAFFGNACPAQSGDTLSGPVALALVGGARTADQRGAFSRAIVATTPEVRKHLALSWETNTWLPPWDPRKVESYAANDAAAMSIAAKEGKGQGVAKGETWWLTLAAGGDRRLFHDRFTSRPIPPKGSDTYAVWLRFGDASDPLAPAQAALHAYGKAHPMKFSWPDRRPIIPTMIGDQFPYHEPEGPDWKRPAPGPRAAEVRETLLKHADDLIALMKRMNAQGVIVWNIEGNGPPALKYPGEPHMIEYMCPEADAVADEFFKKIRDAGFKVGVCLRPSVIDIGKLADHAWLRNDYQDWTKTGYTYYHTYPHQKRRPADILSEKVAYAKKRWGCTLFYVDSNFSAGWFEKKEGDPNSGAWYEDALNEDVWAEVLKRHPDVLFTIEHTPLIQYTINAPFDGVGSPFDGTPPVVRATWPEAFKLLTTMGGGRLEHFWHWVELSERGDVVLSSGEFLDEVNAAAGFLKAGPPKELAAMGPEQLLAAAVDPKAEARLRFFAAQKLCTGKPDAAAIDQLLAAEGRLVPMLAIESLKTPDEVAAHAGQFTRLPYSFQFSFWSGPVRAAMARGGPKAVRALVEHIKKTPAEPAFWHSTVKKGLDVLYDTPGPDATAALAAVVADAAQPQELRLHAVYLLGFRPDGSAVDKDVALGFLLPQLGDPKTRSSAVGLLHPPYIRGLWKSDPRVLEAAKAAAEKEKAAAAPDKDLLAALEALIQGQFR